MNLFLVQHGQAKSEAEDPQRSLTDDGADAVRRMAAWAARAGARVDQIRHSGKRRAEQTATLLAEQLKPTSGAIAVAGLNPNDEVRPLAEQLRSEQEGLMLVGHLPSLSRLASLLVAGNAELEVVRFRNAGIVCLARQEGRWSIEWVMIPDLLVA